MMHAQLALRGALALLTALASSLATFAQEPAQEPLQPVPEAGGAAGFEVLVLGTYHAPGMFRSPQYTPAHIRATLRAAEPDVVAVESHPAWFAAGRYHVVTYEAEGVAVPFARERGLPVYGVDWKDIEAWDRSEERRALRAAEPLSRLLASGEVFSPSLFGKLPSVPRRSREALEEGSSVSWEHINGDEFGRSRYTGKSPDDEDFIGRRDRGIAENCVDVMRAHPGKRLVIVVGAHHKPFLDIAFGRMAGVRVLKLGRDVPLPGADDVGASWTTNDIVATLGHSLDAGSSAFHASLVDAERTWEILATLEAGGERPHAVRYFRARLNVLAGELDAAERDLDELIDAGVEEDVYPFPMREWRMRYTLSESARLEKARILLSRGEREEAAALLGPVRAAVGFRLSQLEATRPRELRRVDCIKDPGFELGERASDVFGGWSTYLPTGHGKLRFDGDETLRVEGDRALRIEVEESNGMGYGFHVRQEVAIPGTGDDATRLRFELSLRGEGVDQVRIEIGRPYWSTDRTALATTTVDLSGGEWTSASVEAALPERGEAALYVYFDGEPGAKLWLDGATPITREYMTIPREWGRLVMAHAFPDSLLRADWGELGPEETRRELEEGALGLIDAGFERGRFAPSPASGWYCYGETKSLVRVEADETTLVEGKRSLCVELLAVPGEGRCSINQAIDVPAGTGEMEFSIALRGDQPWSVMADIGVWDEPTRFRSLARRELRVSEKEWSRHTVGFDRPTTEGKLGIFLYLANDPGRRVWLDDARLVELN